MALGSRRYSGYSLMATQGRHYETTADVLHLNVKTDTTWTSHSFCGFASELNLISNDKRNQVWLTVAEH